MDCQKAENLKGCTCTYEPCPRKGKCCQCVIHHRDNNELPGCFFSKKGEATYDRSIEAYMNDQK